MVRHKVAYRAPLNPQDEPTVYKRAPAALPTGAGKGGRKPKAGGGGAKKKPRVPSSDKVLPDATLRRAVLVYGPRRVGPKALREMHKGVEDILGQVVADATRSAACEGRKTIKGRDTQRALKARGIILV